MCPVPRASIAGSSARMSRNGPRRFTARWRSKSSGSVSASGASWKTPAALTSASTARPSSTSSSWPTRRCTAPGSETSAGIAWPPTSSAAARSAASPRATITTAAPAARARRAVSRPIPREAPVTRTVRPWSAPPSTDDAIGHREPQELLARLQVLQEDARRGAGDRLRVLLLHAAHHHAQVVRLDDDAHALGPQRVPHRLRDLVRHPLLHLEPPREDLDDARQLRQADDLAVRDVGDVDLAEERKHVVLAQRVHFDVLHEHHVVVILVEDRVADHLVHGEPVAACQPRQALLHALRRTRQALALRILAEPPQDLADQVLESDILELRAAGVRRLSPPSHFAPPMPPSTPRSSAASPTAPGAPGARLPAARPPGAPRSSRPGSPWLDSPRPSTARRCSGCGDPHRGSRAPRRAPSAPSGPGRIPFPGRSRPRPSHPARSCGRASWGSRTGRTRRGCAPQA